MSVPDRLIATTALVATAGVAAADVSVAGNGFFGVTYGGTWAVQDRVRVDFNMARQGDNGLAFSGWLGLGSPEGGVRGRWLRVSAEGFSLTVGNTAGAVRNLARHAWAYGYNGGGVIGAYMGAGLVAGDGPTYAGTTNVYAQYQAGAFTAGLGTDALGTTWDIAARYSQDGITIGLGIDSTNAWSLAAGYSMDDLTVNLGYNSASDIALSVSYAMGDFTVGAGWTQEGATNDTRFGLNGAYSLGGGASLVGTVGQNETNATVAGLGVTFSF